MPDEVFIIALVAMTLGAGVVLFLVWNIIAYLKWKRKGPEVPSPSLTASELKRLMRQAVEEANADLDLRLAALEARADAAEADRPRLAARSEHVVDAEEDDEAPRSARQPAKSR